jgi:hypothetical protein
MKYNELFDLNKATQLQLNWTAKKLRGFCLTVNPGVISMKKIIINTVIIVVAIIVGYFIGSISSSISDSNRLMDEYYWRVSEVPIYELEFLKALDIKTLNTLKSGDYIFEVWLPGQKPEISTITIPFKDGQFNYQKTKKPGRTDIIKSALIEFPAVSWHYEGRFYDPGIQYVGIVSGNTMWGRVYCYKQGPKEEIGFWKIYPKQKD